MKSAKRGKNISEVEIQGVSQFGLWMFVRGAEYFLPYSEFPWFKEAKISEILHVRLIHEDHLEWPDLDVDLEIESLQSPEKYPLKYSK